MRARRNDAARAPVPDARAQGRDVVADRFERKQEQAILLEAVAAAAALHEFVLERGGRELDGTALQHVEILERNGLDVRLDDRVQHIECRLGRTVVADTSEVRGKIHGISRRCRAATE